MRGFVLGVIVTLIAIFGGSYLYMKLGLFDVSAIPDPGKMERHMAFMSLDASVERRAPKGPNPVPLTDDVLIDAAKEYEEHCSMCHGSQNSKAMNFGNKLSPRAPNLDPPSHGRSRRRDLLDYSERYSHERHAGMVWSLFGEHDLGNCSPAQECRQTFTRRDGCMAASRRGERARNAAGQPANAAESGRPREAETSTTTKSLSTDAFEPSAFSREDSWQQQNRL